jgi:hypothetical protein
MPVTGHASTNKKIAEKVKPTVEPGAAEEIDAVASSPARAVLSGQQQESLEAA